MTASTTLVDAEDLRPRVDLLLAEHVERLAAEMAASGEGTGWLVEAMHRMLSGGKRLRAAFCYWSWRAHGGRTGDPEEVAVARVGAALELFQAAALFHDDVMDGSDSRRGLPAAHRAAAARHVEQGWSGDPDRYGQSAAILLGDLALIAAEREFEEALGQVEPSRAVRTRAVFDRMRTEVTVGQFLDLQAQVLPWGEDPAEDERRAREVIRAKTARYSVEHPVLLGAALAGADEQALVAASGFGEPLGEAFQLRDDLLGVFGDPSTTGKPAGDDLREGKRTVLVARAMAQGRATGDEDLVTALRDRLGDRDLSAEDGAGMADLIARSGAVEQVEDLIDDLADRAERALAEAALDEAGRGMLARLGQAAVQRRA